MINIQHYILNVDTDKITGLTRKIQTNQLSKQDKDFLVNLLNDLIEQKVEG